MNLAFYLIQVNIYLILFYIFYALVLKKETFFVLNRIYLMGTAILALVIPLLQVSWFRELWATKKVQETAQIIIIQAEPIVITPTAQSGLTYTDYLTFIYFAGVVFFALRLLILLLSVVFGQIKQGRGAWSFFNRIVVSQDLPSRDTIIVHEKVHVQQFHSADRLFAELIAIFCWFNPAVYRLKKAIKNIHEFIADEISAKGNKAAYATLLVSEAIGIKPHMLVNSFFNESLLKQRIIMLSKTKSKKVAIWKYGLSAPLFVGMLIVSSSKLEATAIADAESSIGNLNALDISVSSKSIQVQERPTMEEFYRKNPDVKKISWFDKGVIILYKNGKSERFILETADQKKVVKSKFGPLPSIFPPPKQYPKPIILKDSKPASRNSTNNVSKIDVTANFPGGMEKFFEFFNDNFKMPKAAIDRTINGRLIVGFVIDTDGSLNAPKVLRKLGFGIDEEALRVLKLSPKWLPAMKGDKVGKAVQSNYVIPIQIVNKADDNSIGTKNMLELSGPDAKTAFILLDGKRITSEEFKKLDANSIASVDVVKDKSKFNEYGAPHESSGVISIKTKK